MNKKSIFAFVIVLIVTSMFAVSASVSFAELPQKGSKGNPPGHTGGPGAGPRWKDNPNKIDNPPGPVGGQGTDWRNPPGPTGGSGSGTGMGNPPGPMGGQGSGPRWSDNPNKIDNPPGPVGGQGTDWSAASESQGGTDAESDFSARADRNSDGVVDDFEKNKARRIFAERMGANPPGPTGGSGTGTGNPPGPMGGQGSGPRWSDNPNKIDNPPGSVGGQGTDWKNPPGPQGGSGVGPRRSKKQG